MLLIEVWQDVRFLILVFDVHVISAIRKVSLIYLSVEVP